MNKSQWIKVEDETPCGNTYMYLYGKNIGVMWAIACHEEGGFFAYRYGYKQGKITHWMNKPEPPEES